MDDTPELVTVEERNEILNHVRDEFVATVDQITAGRNVDGSDAAEIGTSLALAFVSALVPAAAKPVVALVGPMLADTLVNAVEAAEARARTPERIAERIEEIDLDIADHEAAIEALQATPKRELFERVRIALRKARINALERKAGRLEAYLDAVAG